ncbi:hypothetical protein I7I53_08665 [Histoplasma capsulatum var. duboisii H88]|uniref:Uncharacterized protein n=1 Tax=Ajellomyces capsulatus (strain H88) TaxID=544711 RepID=A0A8A1LHA5_AJEC8|nr:hypothetical protein I7I53_08665 [Histoplasma capsulatum var. duboisii H88]
MNTRTSSQLAAGICHRQPQAAPHSSWWIGRRGSASWSCLGPSQQREGLRSTLNFYSTTSAPKYPIYTYIYRYTEEYIERKSQVLVSIRITE